jgi:hypothetical protein
MLASIAAKQTLKQTRRRDGRERELWASESFTTMFYQPL